MKKLDISLPAVNFSQLRNDLHCFFSEFPVLFRNLFQCNELIEYRGNYLDALLELGIVSKVDDMWSSVYSIYEFEQQYFVADSFLLAQTERVFPLSKDESLFLARKIDVKNGEKVLDIGTGSGIYAIIAAKMAASVVAIDINDKALNYAQFNALLNNVADKIEFISSDVFSNIDNIKFNLIISNPAIIPTAEGSAFYIHSDGGIDGTRMAFRILENFHNFLEPNGRLQILATSFLFNTGLPVIEEFIKCLYADKEYHFTIQELYKPRLDSLSSLTNNFSKTPNYKKFVSYFDDKGYSSLCYLYLIAQPGPFGISKSERVEEFELTKYNGSWKGRLARLFMVYDKIVNRKITKKALQ